MNDQNLKSIEKLAQFFGSDRLMSKEEIALVLKAIAGILGTYKQETENLNGNTKKLINSILAEIENQNDKLLEDFESVKNEKVKEFNSETAKRISEIEKITKKVEQLKTKVESIKVENGKDADEEYVIAEVLRKIKLPEYKETIILGEDLVSKINELSTEPENQIDAKHIKNLPEWRGKGVGGISKVTVQKMIDDSGASGVTLKTDGTNNGSQSILNLIGGTNITLTDNGSGGVTIDGPTGGTGDVVGPASSVDNTIPRYDSTTGKLIQTSGVSINDSDVMTAVGLLLSGLTASKLLATDGSKNLVSLDTATYPSLTELSYIKGLTSAVQTQLDTKITASSTSTLTNKTISGASNTISNLDTTMFATNIIDTDVTLSADSDTRLATQKAVKAFVDNYLTGLQWKAAVACATTANITLVGEQTVDGIATSSSRILVKNQSTASLNGIYVSGAGAWTRATDANTGTELVGATVFVTGGTTNGDTQWTCTNDSITLGVTNITFAQVSGAGTYSAGTGLSLSGNQFSIDSTVATLSGTQTLTNKTINLSSNTLTGTIAQFNTALSDADFATLAGTETLSNKTLTAPKFADLGFIADANGNEMLIFDTVASATNEFTFKNAPNGSAPELQITGSSDSNVDMKLVPKGTGIVKGELKRFMVRLVASDTDQAVANTVGGDYRISNRAITVKAVGSYCDTAGTTGTYTVDINEAGTTILSTKITVDSTEKSSETAATAPVISDASIAADAIITFDVDAVQTTKAKGLVVWVDYVYA